MPHSGQCFKLLYILPLAAVRLLNIAELEDVKLLATGEYGK
jgi:hypothetical protein